MISRERRALAAMVVATLLWGATFVVIRDSLAAVAPLPLVLLRFAAASPVFAAALAISRRRVPRSALVGGAVSGVIGAGGFLFQAIGLERTPAGSSAFLTFAGTSFAAVFAWVLLGQKPGATLLAGLGMALLGAAILTLKPGLAVGSGEVWTLLGAACFALQIVAIARWAPRTDALALVAVQTVTLAVVLLPWAGSARAALPALQGPTLARLAYLVMAGSVIAPALQVVAQRDLPAGRIGLLFTLEPLFALLFAVTVGAERFAGRWWLGAALIVLAVFFVEGRPRAAAASSRAATAGGARWP